MTKSTSALNSTLRGFMAGYSFTVVVSLRVVEMYKRRIKYKTLPALEKKLPIKVSRFDVSFSNLTERIALASFPTHSYTNAK
jgi:hypothetical protein